MTQQVESNKQRAPNGTMSPRRSSSSGLSVSESLSSVELAVTEAVRAYRTASIDEATRMAPLWALLNSVRAPGALHPICVALSQTRPFLDYAYIHNNGFFVLYVADPDLGLQVRLHVWVPDRPPHHEQPHRHRMGFVSHVIAGTLRSTVYKRAATDDESAELFEELGVSGPAHSDFANNCSGLEVGSLVGLRPVGSKTHHAGETYQFPAAGIHRVDTPQGFTSPVITLTVWEPAFQPSLAYEPVATKTHARPMAVQRLTPDEYDDIIGLVLAATSEGAHSD